MATGQFDVMNGQATFGIAIVQNYESSKLSGHARLTYLKKIMNQLQASLVMTPIDDRFVAFDPEESTELAFSRMKERNIDYAPLLKGDAFIGYVHRKNLANAKGKTCRHVAKEAATNNRISPKISLDDVLGRLVDEPFLFVVKNERLEGIITRADMNRRAFRTLFYVVLSELEDLLVNLIQILLPCERSLYLLGEDRAKDILYNYWKAKARNMEISIEQYLSFSDILNIIIKSKNLKVWALLRCTSRKCVEKLNSLVNLRNKVMHSTRLLVDREDCIEGISQQYGKIWELIESLLGDGDVNGDEIVSVTFDKKKWDFRFVLRSGAVIRTPLNDIEGKELEQIGVEKLRRFFVSEAKTKKMNKTTLKYLRDTLVFNKLFKRLAT
jgi:predicted transcriptional regulator